MIKATDIRLDSVSRALIQGIYFIVPMNQVFVPPTKTLGIPVFQVGFLQALFVLLEFESSGHSSLLNDSLLTRNYSIDRF